MSDIKLFRTDASAVTELPGTSMALEKSLQTLIESNLESFLGIRFLATEFSTGKEHGGRMDTLGIDENGCPVIIEYKRSSNENVINQGLFYLDWLMDHKRDFEWLVMQSLNKESAENVEWSAPRLLCIAGDFTKYDGHAVKQMNRNIELIRYRRYGEELLLLELVNATSSPVVSVAPPTKNGATSVTYKTVSSYLEDANEATTDLFESVSAFLLGLGDDVQRKVLQFYIAFKRLKNFACLEVRPTKNTVLVFVKVNPDTIILEEGFTRDVRKIGHYGTGDLEISIQCPADLERAKPFLEKSYEAS